MSQTIRSVVFKIILTIFVMAGATHLGVMGGVPRAEAQTCSNTECHGYAMCRYMPRVNCALFARDAGCAATRCP